MKPEIICNSAAHSEDRAGGVFTFIPEDALEEALKMLPRLKGFFDGRNNAITQLVFHAPDHEEIAIPSGCVVAITFGRREESNG